MTIISMQIIYQLWYDQSKIQQNIVHKHFWILSEHACLIDRWCPHFRPFLMSAANTKRILMHSSVNAKAIRHTLPTISGGQSKPCRGKGQTLWNHQYSLWSSYHHMYLIRSSITFTTLLVWYVTGKSMEEQLLGNTGNNCLDSYIPKVHFTAEFSGYHGIALNEQEIILLRMHAFTYRNNSVSFSWSLGETQRVQQWSIQEQYCVSSHESTHIACVVLMNRQF